MLVFALLLLFRAALVGTLVLVLAGWDTSVLIVHDLHGAAHSLELFSRPVREDGVFNNNLTVGVSFDMFDKLLSLFPVSIALSHFSRVLIVLVVGGSEVEEGFLVVGVGGEVHAVLESDVLERGVGSGGSDYHRGCVVRDCHLGRLFFF